MTFTLVSKATIKATQALKLATRGIFVQIGQDLTISIYNASEGSDYLDICYGTVANTRLKGLSVKSPYQSPRQCIDHYQEVFWHKKKIFIEIERTATDYQWIYEEFKDIKFESLNGLEWARRCAMNFSRQCDEVDLGGEPLFTQTACEFQNFVCQKFTDLKSAKKCTLNDLLVMESQNFVSSIDFEELNLFLKFWIEGYFQQLKFMELSVESDMSDQENIAILFKNIRYEKAPNNKVFEYRYPWSFRGGRYIQSKDGITAVVGFRFLKCVTLIVLE